MNKFKTIKKTVPIDHIVPNRWNPNVQDAKMFAKGVQSVKEIGMLGSILVRETGGCYEILDGEHRWRYMKELGYTECPVETMGEIDDKQAQLLTVLLNNLRGSDDIEKRAKIYEALDQGQLSLLPFDAEEIENDKKLFKFDFSQYDAKEGEEKEERRVSRSFLVGLTEEENTVVQKCIAIAKADYKQTPLMWLMEHCRQYLDLHLGGNGSAIREFPTLDDVKKDPEDTTLPLL